EVSSTHLIERSRKQNLKMEKIGIYRNIFASSEAKGKEKFKENKEVLSITECSVPDYSTEEIKGKIRQVKGVGLAKQDNLTERIIANIKQIEVYSKIEVDTNIDNKIEFAKYSLVKKERQGFLNQRIQGAEVYAEASNNKEHKSAEGNNFSRKKGKERYIISNQSQGNRIYKFVDQKYEPKKKSNNLHYEGKENQNRNIIATNDLQITPNRHPSCNKK
ncbi:40955_t:CDS:2, partial [Gigaspora margarita]